MTVDLSLDHVDRLLPGYKAVVEQIQPGDQLKCLFNMHTLAGVNYDVGDILELLEPTELTPHDAFMPPHNWLVKCKHWEPPQPESVWSNIYWMVVRGVLRVVSLTTDLDEFVQLLKDWPNQADEIARRVLPREVWIEALKKDESPWVRYKEKDIMKAIANHLSQLSQQIVKQSVRRETLHRQKIKRLKGIK
jgi:hypothetical protein